jgi:hypothetical protein
MQSVIGIALLVAGVVLIIFGMQASASVGSRLSELFTGTPSDRTIWLLLVGVIAYLLWMVTARCRSRLSWRRRPRGVAHRKIPPFRSKRSLNFCK